MSSSRRTNINKLLFLFLLVIMIGTIGFMLIEKYTFLQALFMTIITISTVGYGTIRELSDKGMIFTIILIVTSFIIVGFIVQSITQYISEGELKKDLKIRKFKRAMKNLENHVIVCGYGLNGSHAVQELISQNEKVVIIDNKIDIEDIDLPEDKYILVKGDAKKEEVLEEAKIHTAKALIAALATDADNLFVVLTARELNPKLKIVSRASEDTSDHKLKIAGADFVILPDSVGGVRMAKLITQPDVIEFLENILAKSGIDVNLIEVNCSDIAPELLGKSIYELDIRKKSGANIIGMKLKDGTYIFNPSAELKIDKGSKLFILGTPEQVDVFKKITKEN